MSTSLMVPALVRDPGYKVEELLITVIAELLHGVKHVAVGVSSPIPAAAAVLSQLLSTSPLRVSIIGNSSRQAWADSGVEMFDCAAQGRIDAFFLSGGQIDGHGNVNLVGAGEYPQLDVRWRGSFGSAFLYFLVSKVILFREKHTRQIFVPKVDFVSAPGTSRPGTYRPGGPYALVTNLCSFSFRKAQRCFRLETIHPGHTLEEIRDHTGFNFEVSASLSESKVPTAAVLDLIRTSVADQINDYYPKFNQQVLYRPASPEQPD